MNEPPEEPDDWHLYVPGGDEFLGEFDPPAKPAPSGAVKPAQSGPPNQSPADKPAPPLAAAPPAGENKPSAVEAPPVEPRTAETRTPVEPKIEAAPQSSPADLPPVHGLPVPPVPFLITPLIDAVESQEPRMVSVILRSTGDKERDIRRLKMIYGKLRSFPGQDRFSFLVFEGSHQYLLEFPNDCTGICPALLQELNRFVGEGNVRTEPIRIQ
jgi:DNA polymerase-3 subunit alpha